MWVEELNVLDSDYRYRLPGEAEWELPRGPVAADCVRCRLQIWINMHGLSKTQVINLQVVATRKPNASGVYDMLGNAWEWVDDWYAAESYAQAAVSEPAVPAGGFDKVRRGGSCHCPVHLLCPGYRAANKPGVACEVNGFRVIAEPR